MRRLLIFYKAKKNTQYLLSYPDEEKLSAARTREALILTSLSARLHHHPTSHSIKRIRNQPCHCSDTLGNHPAHYDVHVLWIRQHTCHQEQMNRISTEGKRCGKHGCGRNNHPPTPESIQTQGISEQQVKGGRNACQKHLCTFLAPHSTGAEPRPACPCISKCPRMPLLKGSSLTVTPPCTSYPWPYRIPQNRLLCRWWCPGQTR